LKLGNFNSAGKTRPQIVCRTLFFVIALLLLLVVTTRWTSWQGVPGWQATDDAYLQADLARKRTLLATESSSTEVTTHRGG
jgi:hypothetical protein